MGMFSRADEDWAGCDSGCDYFFANIYDGKVKEKTPEELKWEEAKKHLEELDKDRRSRFHMRYAKTEWEVYKKRVGKENLRFLAHLETYGTHVGEIAIKEFYPNRKDKFSCDLYEQGFSLLNGCVELPFEGLHEKKIIVEMPDYVNYVTIDIVYRNHPNHRLCIPTETYKTVLPIREMITRKKYKTVGFKFYKRKILRLSAGLNTVCKNYDEVPSLFIHAVG